MYYSGTTQEPRLQRSDRGEKNKNKKAKLDSNQGEYGKRKT